jgi:hypothetical protein
MTRYIIEFIIFLLIYTAAFILWHIGSTPTEFIYYNF